MPSELSELPPGYPRRLGRYTLIAPLGEGGMATVHVAQRDGDPRVCVLKQLHGQLADHEETNRRFHREAHIASFLNHPGIAQVVDAGLEAGVFCIALELVAGQTVEQMIKAARRRGGTLPFEVSIHVIIQALDALTHAHELQDPDGRAVGLVHRDLSPRNVMVGYDGHAKIIDFGIAKGRVDDHRTAVGVLMGTPYYMSPEQARAVEIDHRSDLYTIGTVLYEMLTGHRLVTVRGRAKILMSVVKDVAPPLTTRNPHAPPELETVLARALQKHPDRRYPTARAFASALRQAYEGALRRSAEDDPQNRLHSIETGQVGQFLKELFPDGEKKARHLLEMVRRIGASEAPVEPTRFAAPEVELDLPTRAATPAELAGEGFVRTPAEPTETVAAFPALDPTILGLPLESRSSETPRAPTVTETSALRNPTRDRPGRRRAGAAAALVLAVGLMAAVVAVGYDQAPDAKTASDTSSPDPNVRRPNSQASAVTAPPEVPAKVIAASREEATVPPLRHPGNPELVVARAVSDVRPERPPSRVRRKGRPKTVRRRPEREAPPPARPERRPASPAMKTAARLGKRVALLRARPERSSALELAEAIHRAAEVHLSGRSRARVQAEAERVMRSADVDVMLEALESALSVLREAAR